MSKNPSLTSDLRHPTSGAFAPLCFETITCAPIDTRLVEPPLLSESEKRWLNAYHAWVLETLSDALDEHERIWLAERCAAVK